MNLDAFYKITYGLYTICSSFENKKSGYVSNTVMQVSNAPCKIATCCSKNNYTAELINKSGHFSVTALSESADDKVIRLFGYRSGRDLDKFKDLEYTHGVTGVPIVTGGAIAWFECRIAATVDVGTHWLFIADIINNELIAPELPPMTYSYFRTVYKGKSPKNAPTFCSNTPIKQVQNNNPSSLVCQKCGYHYDKTKGDPTQSNPPNLPFDQLPDTWSCPLCNTPKDKFLIKTESYGTEK